METTQSPATQSFTGSLDKKALEFFNDLAQKPFGEQGVAFLNAYWSEISDQAEFIFSVGWDQMKKADMHAKGISLIHLYEEGIDLDFDIALYFYEKLCKFLEDHPEWAGEEYKKSQPTMMTALKRKTELREKVDVNFDGRVSFIEYLLYQYQEFANPADFVSRSIETVSDPPEVRAAKEALEAVNKRIRAFEAEKSRLEGLADQPGVKGMKAKNELAQLYDGPLTEQLNEALIRAEYQVRLANKTCGVKELHGRKSTAADCTNENTPNNGSVFWMNRDLEEKKKLYGKKGK